jgi:uncharacterized alkaline shock family protein YloU
MTTQPGTTQPGTTPPADRPAGVAERPRRGTAPGGHELVTEHGRTRVANVVVQKIAGIAAREVPGVYGLGAGAARAMGALRGRVGMATPGTGVSVEVGEKQAAVDLDLIVEYGVAIHEVAGQVRDNVIGAIERMTLLEVTEVNVTVHDMHIEGEEEEPAPVRVE